MTPENYRKLGGAWIETKGGFLMSLRGGEHQGEKFEATPRQWGAWRAYFKERGIKTAFMDEKARSTIWDTAKNNPHCWTVPTEWPHEFDREATVQGDHQAAEMFMRKFRPERLDLAAAAQRQATVAAYKRWKTTKAKQELPQEQTKPASFIDEDRLLDGYERDMAEWKAKNAKPVTAGSEAA